MICWILTDGRTGTENNAKGLAESLGLAYELKKVTLRQPWKTLSPWLRMGLGLAVSPKLKSPWPDITITAGRTPAVAALYIKQQRPQTVAIHITDPGVNPGLFDMVIAPAHDRLTGNNVVVTTGALHRIAPPLLEIARAQWEPLWAHLPRPFTGILIGGDANGYELTPDLTANWMQYFQNLRGSLFVTTSRRTSPAITKMLKSRMQGPHHIFWTGEADGPNPYPGIMALADQLFVTNESVNMLSESASTGKPVYTLNLKGHNRKIDALNAALVAGDHVRRFTQPLPAYTPVALDDMAPATAAVTALLKKKGLLS